MLKSLLESNKHMGINILKEKMICFMPFNILKLGEQVDGESTKCLVIGKTKVFQSPWRAQNEIVYKKVTNMCKIG